MKFGNTPKKGAFSEFRGRHCAFAPREKSEKATAQAKATEAEDREGPSSGSDCRAGHASGSSEPALPREGKHEARQKIEDQRDVEKINNLLELERRGWSEVQPQAKNSEIAISLPILAIPLSAHLAASI